MPLPWILRNWLTNTAKEHLFDAVSEAARQPADDSARGEEASQPLVCQVGCIAALSIELAGLEDRLSGVVSTHASGLAFREGGLRGRQVTLLASGIGRQAAARGTAVLIAGHHPRWVISAGFAGGLQPQLRRGEIVLANSTVDESGPAGAISVDIPPGLLCEKPGVHVGRLLTVDRIVRTPAQKRMLGEQHQALAVDMESHAVAEVCRKEGSPFLAVRVISDSADDELPPDLERLTRQKSTAGKLGAALGMLVDRPSSAKDLWKLKEDALVASDRLAVFLEELIGQVSSIATGPS